MNLEQLDQLLVYVNDAGMHDIKATGHSLLEQRLASRVELVDSVPSLYINDRGKRKVGSQPAYALFVHTDRERIERVLDRLTSLDGAMITVLPVVFAHPG